MPIPADDFDAYWHAFNGTLADVDVIWTKPSEMVFYAGLGIPLILALNVMDSARSQGIRIDEARLSVLLGGAPVVETVGHRGRGVLRVGDRLVEPCLLLGRDGERRERILAGPAGHEQHDHPGGRLGLLGRRAVLVDGRG